MTLLIMLGKSVALEQPESLKVCHEYQTFENFVSNRALAIVQNRAR